MTTPHADRDHSEVPDLLAALQGSIDKAREARRATKAPHAGIESSSDPMNELEPGTSRSAAARATPAQVEAAMRVDGCRVEDGGYCAQDGARWSERGCSWCVDLADAVVAAGVVLAEPVEAAAPVTDDERAVKYAQAIDGETTTHRVRYDGIAWLDDVTDAVMAVADAEQADLRAENERLRDALSEFEAKKFAPMSRINRAERVAENAVLDKRAAEATVARVKATLHVWSTGPWVGNPVVRDLLAALDAALAGRLEAQERAFNELRDLESELDSAGCSPDTTEDGA